MKSIQITINGADSGHRTRMLRQTSRIWLFPDNNSRIITMSGWHWEAFDRLVGTEKIHSVAESCYNLAQEEVRLQTDTSLDFEQWIQKIARDYVRLSWDDEQSLRGANTNGGLG